MIFTFVWWVTEVVSSPGAGDGSATIAAVSPRRSGSQLDTKSCLITVARKIRPIIGPAGPRSVASPVWL